jgi:hypothetical protein
MAVRQYLTDKKGNSDRQDDHDTAPEPSANESSSCSCLDTRFHERDGDQAGFRIREFGRGCCRLTVCSVSRPVQA